MVGDDGRELRVALTVQADAVGVAEIRIFTGFTSLTLEPDGARLLVEAQHLHDGTVAGRHLVLQRAGRQVVEIDVAPVVAFGIPEHLVRSSRGSGSRCAIRTAWPPSRS